MDKKNTFIKDNKKNTLQPPVFLNPVAAGFPSPADDYLDKNLDLNEYLIKNNAATFFVKVQGNSMKDANILDGDILIVDRSIEAVNKKIIIASLNGEFTVKRLKIVGKDIFLEPENKKFESIKILEGMDFEIFGVVTYIIHAAR